MPREHAPTLIREDDDTELRELPDADTERPDDEEPAVIFVVEPLFVEETVVEGAESVVDVCTVVDEFDDRSALLPVFPRTLPADGTLTIACDPVRDFVAPLE